MKSFLSMQKNYAIKSLALGKFDGMHLAHRILIKELYHQGALLCLEMEKEDCLTPKNEKSLYTTLPIFYLPISKVRQKNGIEFVCLLRQKFPNLSKLVVGYDFRFGKDREFGANDLPKLFDKQVVIVPEYRINGVGVHSTLIKDFIRLGDMNMANALLGRLYCLYGKVVSGQNLGSKYLYATINIETKNYVIPQEGVYVSLSEVDQQVYPSVSFIGHRLSTDRRFGIESHILDKNITLRKKEARIYFVQKIRDNQVFEDLNELKKRIAQDIVQARDILALARLDSMLSPKSCLEACP
ncbi:bifunctional riboflavin kinase/FAD synthetase [Helicobacter sp. MIT 05-5293]|uniref:bifunctional riboflavin kinase/FAD synthetase n=1 Tax=Helicobacter sp. MIT 05-5293 TaxID=1548149 RepID=UPI000691B086|nr:bifunctional riboflavin kinase/FAD synthetase [Helicobacter sp. MIT 05-5293]TLD80093.1 bifunctional riboflavin kinase/FAD synthetase [Helicobacter sp. MIT 05-5293]